jgi:hypothetical protein
LIRNNPTSAQAAELAESDRAQNIVASLQKAANAARDEIAGVRRVPRNGKIN